ncbi:MAG: response regulator [Candidatus Tectimicrobiota bacterium]
MALDAAHALWVVEDSDEDMEALRFALRQVGMTLLVEHCRTGREALARLRAALGGAAGAAPKPALLLLDLNLPGLHGRDVLAAIRADVQLQVLPVVVWTTSAHPGDVAFCYRHGVNGYLLKPVNFDRFQEIVRYFVAYWFEAALLPTSVEGL